MPERLAPGVFVEETSFRQKTIEGVSTSITGFVGPCRFGPIDGKPESITSFSDFERIYGGIDQLEFVDIGQAGVNYLAHAVRAYFEEGGRRLYVARVFNSHNGNDGVASWTPIDSPVTCSWEARYPGTAGEHTMTFIFKLGDNSLHTAPVDPTDPEAASYPVLRRVREHDVVLAGNVASAPGSDEDWYTVEAFFDTILNLASMRLRGSDGTTVVGLGSVSEVRKLTVSVIVGAMGKFGSEQSWKNLAFDAQHTASIASVFTGEPSDRSSKLYVPAVFETRLTNGAAIAEALLSNTSLAGGGTVESAFSLGGSELGEANRSFRIALTNGNDGDQPTPADYTGREGAINGIKSGLRSFEDVDDISIVAAPGSSFDFSDQGGTDHSRAIVRRLINHCEQNRYRVAVLDSVNGNNVSDVRDYRSVFDSSHAALYYPWIRTFDPLTEQYINVPPSGSVCGIYARNDGERGVNKAPANEIVRMSAGLEFVLNNAEQEVLNPLGINCLRFFEGRGYRIWGARTASSDPEWKYINVRRYFAFLEHSIERGTQWAVFETNGPQLWANIRRTIEDFLLNEWRQGHLSGSTQDQAYFVRCDRSTMTQNDLDNGRLICLIGVAPLRPAEFVIFRIGQKTADS